MTTTTSLRVLEISDFTQPLLSSDVGRLWRAAVQGVMLGRLCRRRE